ncbi:MAG: 3-hydroxyacyl-CoA dehydrogenase/enoyl-CoA hydratase family protein [Legionella sp.]|nr:3-hydroxyacyl-CoA dehydrogenase/enoyl-CoA hydratase family protein [Legionella sp.]
MLERSLIIKKIAVLGAGVMGAQIAAHCVNAGIQTFLFDLDAKEADKNELVKKAIAHLQALKPTPLASKNIAELLQPCNYDEHLETLMECDLVIEAIAERMDWKESLYQKITPFLRSSAVLVTNTSGLSVNRLAEVLPEEQRERFCGVHFFNPPRYMHLAELIPSAKTNPFLVDALETWLTRYLGKGVVRAKDTPNFIANRIGIFSLLITLHHADAYGLGFDEVDALTGALIGRPKSATFRTMDVVGLDTMKHVIDTMQDQLAEDPWHGLFQLPQWMLELINQGHLGQKSGQGIYRKLGKNIEVYDQSTKSYRPAQTNISGEVSQIMKMKDYHQRMKCLLACEEKQAQFLMACYRDLFHYSAFHLETIADSVRDIDLAMRWGFGWQEGPFESWQKSDLAWMRNVIETNISKDFALASKVLPTWVAKTEQFYLSNSAYSPVKSKFIARSNLPVYKRQFFPDRLLDEAAPTFPTLFENDALRLWCLPNDVGILSFKTKANTIGRGVVDGLNKAIEAAEAACSGLVIYQFDPVNFSAGANLQEVLGFLQANDMVSVEQMLVDFQTVLMRMKYSHLPVVAAVRGRALGGGCELLMHCDRVVASLESYPGLVEMGVGLIPAGGGCKEMALRAAQKTHPQNLFTTIQPYFQQIATGFVAASAIEGTEKGYFKENTHCIMHREEVLYAAVAEVSAMQALNYQAPLKTNFQVAGREGHAKLQAGLINWLEGSFISAHDYFLANELASVICGGDVNQGEWVNEEWMLALERKAFMKLAETPLSQARMQHLLETGKPLRN